MTHQKTHSSNKNPYTLRHEPNRGESSLIRHSERALDDVLATLTDSKENQKARQIASWESIRLRIIRNEG